MALFRQTYPENIPSTPETSALSYRDAFFIPWGNVSVFFELILLVVGAAGARGGFLTEEVVTHDRNY